jgi:hypothetical protein
MPSDGGRKPSLAPTATDGWARELAVELADRLDGWAMEREKILSKLDIRGAKAARGLARSLRQIAKLLGVPPEATNDPERKTAGSKLVLLRRDALKLMSSGADALSPAELAELAEQSEDDDAGPATLDREVGDEESKERPTISPPDPISSGPRKRKGDDDDVVTGAHTPESLRARKPDPEPPSTKPGGGLGDYIARIRKLKG